MPANQRDICLARQLANLGIVHPHWTIKLARALDLDISLCAAILLQETGGGRNVFGHDPYIKPTRLLNWLKGRKVTRARYAYYKRQRRRGHGMQGVGPMQLTWFSFQDTADAKGGSWRPYVNMQVGFGILAAHIAGKEMFDGVASYNGGGQAANDYARQVLHRRERVHHYLQHC